MEWFLNKKWIMGSIKTTHVKPGKGGAFAQNWNEKPLKVKA